MNNFIEITDKETGSKMIVNPTNITVAVPENGEVGVLISGGEFVLEESYDQLKKLLNVRTEETLRHEESLKEGSIGSVINLVEDVEGFASNPVSSSLNVLADAAEAVGDLFE